MIGEKRIEYPDSAEINLNIHLHTNSDRASVEYLTECSSEDLSNDSVQESPGQQSLQTLDDGTQIRHEFKRGDHAGEVATARIFDGDIVYNGEKMSSPSAAVRRAVEDIKGEPVHGNGWTWWRFYDDEDSEWKPLDVLRD